MSDIAAQWREDPDGRHEWRYWNGTRWTEHVADRGAVSTDPLREDTPEATSASSTTDPVEPTRQSDGAEDAGDAAGEAKDDGGKAKDDGAEAKDDGGEAKDESGEAKDDDGEAKDESGEAKDDDGEAKDESDGGKDAGDERGGGRSGGDEEEEVGTGDEREGGLYGSDTGANMVTAAVAETIGTFLLIFAGTAVAVAAILAKPTAGNAYDSLSVALAFGLTLAAVVAALGHVSGAHVNPAVTLGLAVTGRFPWKFVPAYLAAQVLGAVGGALATWVTFGSKARDVANLAATYPTSGVSDGRAVVVEALVTFALVFIVVSVATDKRAAPAAAPLAVGFALTTGVLIAGPVTGGAVNPARALGPMLVAGDLTSFWLYIVGPVIGGIVAALVYDRFVAKGATPE